MRVLVINGPNLNLLGRREPEIYGTQTLEEINESVRRYAEERGVEVEFFQSNCEGEIVDAIHGASVRTPPIDAVVINPGAYSHYSLAIMDAIKATGVRTIEVHLTNPHAREGYRRRSVTASACQGVIAGFGPLGYMLAVEALVAARRVTRS